MTELPESWERALRAGPPDESGYVARPILDFSHAGARADSMNLAVAPVVPQTRAGRAISTTRGGAPRWAALFAGAALVIGLAIGRATAPAGSGAVGGSGKLLAQPAYVADDLVNAWTRSTINLNRSSTTFMICLAGRALACELVAATDLGPAASSAGRGGLSPSTPVRTYWGRLHPATIDAGHVAGAVGIATGAGPTDSVDARLMALDGPDNDPGVQIEPVTAASPCYFFDLGTVAPGSYTLVVVTNPTSSGSGSGSGSELYAAGLIVGNP